MVHTIAYQLACTWIERSIFSYICNVVATCFAKHICKWLVRLCLTLGLLEYYEFQGVHLNGSEADESSYLANIKNARVWQLKVTWQIVDWFTSQCFNNMEIFHPRNWPKEREELILYGKQQIDSIRIWVCTGSGYRCFTFTNEQGLRV